MDITKKNFKTKPIIKEVFSNHLNKCQSAPFSGNCDHSCNKSIYTIIKKILHC